MSRREPERGAQPFLPHRAAAAPELRCSCRRTGPWHGPHVPRPCSDPLPALPSPPGTEEGSEGGKEGGPMRGSARHRPAGLGLGRGGVRAPEGGAEGRRRGSNRDPTRHFQTAPGTGAKGSRRSADTASLRSGRRRSMSRGWAGTAVIAALPNCTQGHASFQREPLSPTQALPSALVPKL